MAAAGAGGGAPAAAGGAPAGGHCAQEGYFPPNRVFLIAGHGSDPGKRFALMDNEYGAIPSKCGEILYVEHSFYENFFSGRPDFCTEVPIPYNNSLVQETSQSIFPYVNITQGPQAFLKTTAKRIIPRKYKIYRPKLPGDEPRNKFNNKGTFLGKEYPKSEARWTMPNLSVNPISYYKAPPEAPKRSVVFKGKTYEDVVAARIGISGIYSSAENPAFYRTAAYAKPRLVPTSIKVRIPFKMRSPDAERIGYIVNIDVNESIFSKTIQKLYSEIDMIGLSFVWRLEDSLEDSLLTFEDILILAMLKIEQPFLSISDFMRIRSDPEESSEYIEAALTGLTLEEIVSMTVPLSFIYEFLSRITNHEEFMVVAPLCRDFSEGLSRRNKSRARRFSINEGKPAFNNAEGGRRRRRRRLAKTRKTRSTK
jgi:hypothetical protein